MANEEQLKILKQGVEVWNQWREEHPDEKIDLSEADLRGANLRGANLRQTNLHKADLREVELEKAKFREAHLSEAILNKAKLYKADLFRADLHKARLNETFLLVASFTKANLSEADLRGADLREAALIQTDLCEANLTGAKLYATARDDWKIDSIRCKYVFWDSHGKQRTPQDRDFRPGEFEELYKHLPTIEYYFEQGFTPLDAVVMDQVVQDIQTKHPEFELRLDSFHSRGQPHAVFTVLHQEDVENALSQITSFYETKIKVLEGKREQLREVFLLLANKPHIGELILGDKKITTGRDYFEQVAGDVTTGENTNEQKKDP